MRIAHTGVHQSEETRRKHSEAAQGRVDSDETRRKKSERMGGVHPSDETKKKISESLRGRHVSDEERCKISESSKGRRWVTNGIENRFATPPIAEMLVKGGYQYGITHKQIGTGLKK